ncbi:MAG: T9SS type A sorting domain-containing protein [Bacteroidia bacterium]
MKTSILSLIIIFVFIINVKSQVLKHGAINLSTEAKASSNVILRKTNLHRLVEVKNNPKAASLELIKEVFPTPFSDNINIEFNYSEKQNISVKIFDVFGNLQKEFLIEKAKDIFYQNLQLKNLSAGIYFLRVQLINSNKSSQVKLIKIN